MQNQQQCDVKLELTFISSLTLSCLFYFQISGALFKGHCVKRALFSSDNTTFLRESRREIFRYFFLCY